MLHACYAGLQTSQELWTPPMSSSEIGRLIGKGGLDVLQELSEADGFVSEALTLMTLLSARDLRTPVQH